MLVVRGFGLVGAPLPCAPFSHLHANRLGASAGALRVDGLQVDGDRPRFPLLIVSWLPTDALSIQKAGPSLAPAHPPPPPRTPAGFSGGHSAVRHFMTLMLTCCRTSMWGCMEPHLTCLPEVDAPVEGEGEQLEEAAHFAEGMSGRAGKADTTSIRRASGSRLRALYLRWHTFLQM